MVAEPALQAEMLRAGKVAESELAAAIADRTGTSVDVDLYPRLVAATVTAANGAAIDLFLQGGAEESMEALLRSALTMLAAGLPTP